VKTAVKTFVIDATNHAKAYASTGAARKCRDGPLFATEGAFASVSAEWPMLRLVAIWNKIPGVRPVQKFTDRRTALRRIWTALQALPTATTKTELVISLLNRRSGATLKQIMVATGWQAHSIRGLISAQLSRKLRLSVESFKRKGERVYRINKEAL
jgi:hypothetical protein